MKTIFTIILFSLVGLSILTLVHEYKTVLNFKANVNKNSMGLPSSSATLKKAKSDKLFAEKESKAADRRISRVSTELSLTLGMIAIALLFTCEFLKSKIKNIAGYRITVLKRNRSDLNSKEINFICIFVILLGILAFRNNITRLISYHFDSWVSSWIFYMLLFFIILPYFFIFIFALFEVFGKKLIIACYLAFFIKAFTEFLSQEEIDLELMEKVPISTFSKEVQEFLIEQKLDDKVYKEKIKSDSINAALVGWGSYEHIEIYGNHDKFSDEEFESILMHEIGHSKHDSLYKKIGVLLFLKLLEMGIVLMLYTMVAEKFSDETVSLVGAFIFLYLLYICFMSKWLMIFHRLTSQLAETSADLIAKKHGYGQSLGEVLYKISVGSGDYLYSTWLYNSLKSYHPSIFARIEYLN